MAENLPSHENERQKSSLANSTAKKVPEDALSEANMGLPAANKNLEELTLEFPNITALTDISECKAALAQANTNGTVAPLPPCTYPNLLEHLPAIEAIQREAKREFSYAPSTTKNFEATLDAYLDMLRDANIPRQELALLAEDMHHHREQAIHVLGDSDPFSQILIKGLPETPGDTPSLTYDPWHIDWDVSQVYLWTPLSDYEHATEGVGDANVLRTVLWQAWQEGGHELLEEPSNFLYNPERVLCLPNNTVSAFLGEIPKTHRLSFGEQLDGAAHFNEGAGFVHRSPGMESGKWRLAARFYTTNIPEHLRHKSG